MSGIDLADLDLDDEPVAEAEIEKPVSEKAWKAPVSGDVLHLDIETVPDESRMELFPFEPIPPFPDYTPSLILKSASEVSGMTVENVQKYISTVNPDPEWFDLLAAEEAKREKGPRKEILKIVALGREAIEEHADEVANLCKTLSLNPLTLQIISIGLRVGSDGDVKILMAEDHDEEAEILAEAFDYIQKYRPVIGFGVSRFDLPAMLMRAAILGVDVPRLLNLSKYSSSDVIDLEQALFNGYPPRGFGMKNVAKMLGIEVPADHGDGSQVYKLWKDGDWAKISKYQRGDIEIGSQIYGKICGKLCG